MKQYSRTTYSLMNMLAGMAGYFLNTVLGFVCRMVFVRCLPTEYLGISGLFGNVLSMLSLAELGVGTAITYALYKPIAQNDEQKIATIMAFFAKAYRIIGIVIGIIGLAMMPFLHYIIGEAPQINENLYIIYVVYLFNTCLTYFFSYKGSLITAFQRHYVQLSVSYIVTIAQSILQIGALLLFKNYMFYLGIQTIGTITFNIVISQKADHDYPYIKSKDAAPLSKPERKSLFTNIKALTMGKIAEKLVSSSDNIIISYFGGLISVGLASNYILLSSVVDTLTKQIFGGLIASVGNLNATESKEASYKFFNIFQFSAFVVFSWTAIGTAFVSSDLVNLFFGEQYVLGPEIPIILGLNFYIVSMNFAANMYRSTLGLFKYGQYILIVTAGINIVVSIWLGSIWGLFGILAATSIARILTNAWYIPFQVFRHGLERKPSEYFIPYLKYFALFILEGIICYFLCNALAFNIVINTVLKFVICTVVPFGFAVIFFRKAEEFQYLFSKVKSIILSMKVKIRRKEQ